MISALLSKIHISSKLLFDNQLLDNHVHKLENTERQFFLPIRKILKETFFSRFFLLQCQKFCNKFPTWYWQKRELFVTLKTENLFITDVRKS